MRKTEDGPVTHWGRGAWGLTVPVPVPMLGRRWVGGIPASVPARRVWGLDAGRVGKPTLGPGGHAGSIPWEPRPGPATPRHWRGRRGSATLRPSSQLGLFRVVSWGQSCSTLWLSATAETDVCETDRGQDVLMKSHRRKPWGAAGSRQPRGALVPSNSSGWSAVPSPPTVTAACLSSPGLGVSGPSCGAADRAWPWTGRTQRRR